MPSSTNEILARLAQWARQIEAQDWRADALTHRDFTADLAALVDGRGRQGSRDRGPDRIRVCRAGDAPRLDGDL
jgi:hypothetical protein